MEILYKNTSNGVSIVYTGIWWMVRYLVWYYCLPVYRIGTLYSNVSACDWCTVLTSCQWWIPSGQIRRAFRGSHAIYCVLQSSLNERNQTIRLSIEQNKIQMNIVVISPENIQESIILELTSPVPHNPIQTVILVSRDLLLRVVPPLSKRR